MAAKTRKKPWGFGSAEQWRKARRSQLKKEAFDEYNQYLKNRNR